VTMFKRLPSLRWSPPRDQQIVSMEAQKQSPLFADDFKTLEDELMPYFRELDAEALRVQNQFRLDQVTLIFGGALATILGAVHASFSGTPAVWAESLNRCWPRHCRRWRCACRERTRRNVTSARADSPDLKPQMDDAAFEKALGAHVEQVEQILRNEQAQWGQLIGETKPVETPS
jgi:hypothetical protein